MLAAIAGLVGDDDLLVARIQPRAGAAPDRLPEWLARLDEAEVYGVLEMVHVLGDGDNVLLRFASPTATSSPSWSTSTTTGHAREGRLRRPRAVGDGRALMRTMADDPDTVVARHRSGRRPGSHRRRRSIGGDHVPAVRVRHLAALPAAGRMARRMLPDGGTGYQRPEWTDAAIVRR